MHAPKFCSQCGEPLRAKRAGLVIGQAICARCATGLRGQRFLKVLCLVLLAAVAFAVGRTSTPPRTVYLIGTPIEPQTASEPSATSAANLSSASQATPSTQSADDIVTICGAPTRSGKPCQRKVKGGGYCWQHRDKHGGKNANSSSQ
jgi:hypothetical protein